MPGRFIKEQPNHPKAMEAIVWLAGFSTDEAMKHLQAAQDPRSPRKRRRRNWPPPARP